MKNSFVCVPELEVLNSLLPSPLQFASFRSSPFFHSSPPCLLHSLPTRFSSLPSSPLSSPLLPPLQSCCPLLLFCLLILFFSSLPLSSSLPLLSNVFFLPIVF